MNLLKNITAVEKWIIVLFIIQMLLIAAQLPAKQKDETPDSKRKLNIHLSFSENDSAKKITALAAGINDDSSEKPATDVELHFYVQRNFGLLPLTSDIVSTNETGAVTVDFPNDLPGDSSGNILIIAKVEDNEEYGNAEVHKTINWGKPLTPSLFNDERALWASGANAPLVLIVVVNAMIAGVWSIIIYIGYQFYKINKSGKHEN